MDIGTYREALFNKYKQAYTLNDEAHRREHFEEVFHGCILISGRVGSSLSEKEIKMYAAAAYLHDLFAWSRINHHKLSYEFVSSGECELLDIFTDEERKEVAHMCLEHRASFKGKFYSLKSEIFSMADLGPPRDVPGHVTRAKKFALAHNEGISEEEAEIIAIAHIKEKYGRGGYASLTPLYKDIWKESLESFYDEVEAL